MNTGRLMNDGHNETGTGERKLIWDEENRLLAVDDNGFVSNYWYDADGERTVKTSGESDQVYVNGVFSGGSTNTAKFSLYVSPYLVANQGGRYTKHIYAGSQRIVSKIGDFASYGSDPRRIEYAGANTDGLSVDYKAKYAAQQQVIKDNYKTFDVPYNGTDNDNYADGEGFCCNDGSMEAAMARTKAQARAVARSFKDPDNYENLQFFYHPDHLGSSSFITNLEGEVVQHIEYVPFGEVFIEERNSVWNTPYLFNAKEFDEETGMYYYGARYYEPRLSLWMSTDPMQEKYPNINSYCYTNNNPIKYIDPDGNDWILATGNRVYWYGGDYGNKSELKNTYKATSGSKSAIMSVNGKKYQINPQNSKYQYVRDVGPTVEGKYKLNLAPEPETARVKNGQIESGRGKGIQSLTNMPNENTAQTGETYCSPAWGDHRINMIPVNVSQPKDQNGTTHTRDLGSFYFHDSTKGETHGCHEVESRFFDDLLKYRAEGNKSIFVKVSYPNANHNTNGGTEIKKEKND